MVLVAMVQASELMSRMPGPSNAVRPVAFRGGLRRVWPGVSDVTDPSRHGMSTPEFVAAAMASAVGGPDGKKRARC